MTAKPLSLLVGPALVAVGGALFGHRWVTGAGVAVVLGVLAVRATAADPAVPRSTRLLLRAGLVLLACAVAVELSGWTTPPRGYTSGDLVALVTDPVRQRTQFLRQVTAATCLMLAGGCLAVVIGRLPQERLRRFGRAMPTVGVLTLVVLVFAAVLLSGPRSVLGSYTNVAVAVSVVFGGYAWVAGRAVRRHGPSAIAAVGAVVLAAATWVAADDAWRSRPRARVNDDFYQTSISVAVSVHNGPDTETALTIAILLVGAALTVLTCARLSRVDDDPAQAAGDRS